MEVVSSCFRTPGVVDASDSGAFVGTSVICDSGVDYAGVCDAGFDDAGLKDALID